MRTPILLDRPPELVALDRLGWLREPSWQPWRTALRALLADPLASTDADTDALQLYTQCTDRAQWPTRRHKEGWFLVGRRGGKTLGMSKLAVALACFTDVTPYLAPGEVATVMLLAADRKQARIAYRYVLGLLHEEPALAALIVGDPTRELIRLRNRTVIEIHTADYRSTRGYTLLACLADEAAFWSREHQANPDVEIINAFRPGLGSIPFSLLVGISTVFARKGALFTAFTDHYGQAPDPDHPVLVWKADTRTMNPRFSEKTIAAAYKSDPAAARAEWGSEFRSDLESYITVDTLRAATDVGCHERPPTPGWVYVAYADPAGSGSEKADSYTLSIARTDLSPDGTVVTAVLDCVREARPPFNPDTVTEEYCELLTRYGITTVVGDRYAGTWPTSRFAAYGITYQVAGRTKSEIYRDLIPLLTSGRARLLDLPRLRDQFLALERRPTHGGKDSIDHPGHGHDDVANACAGALLLALEQLDADVAAQAQEPSPEEAATLRALERYLGTLPTPPGGYNNLALDDDGRPIDRRYAGGESWFPPPPPEQGYVDMS